MQITVTERHVSATEEVKTYAREKAQKLLKYYDRIQSIEVIFAEEGDQFDIEMIVNAGAKNQFVGREVGDNVFALIDVTVDKLERQLTKHKEKFRNRMHLNRRPTPPVDP